MKTISEYQTVRYNTLGEMDDEVRDLILDYWQPYGNHYIDSNGEYCQAMVAFKVEELEERAGI